MLSIFGNRPLRRNLGISLFALALAGAGCSGSSEPTTQACADAVPVALSTCVSEVSDAIASCYADTDATCSADDAATNAALDTLADTVAASCADGEFIGLDTEAVQGRVRNACASEAASMSWRVYGGPQGSQWSGADTEARGCLTAAHAAAAEHASASLAAIRSCLASDECDADALGVERAALAATTEASVTAACDELSSLIALAPATYVDRVDHQVDCLAATGEADPAAARPACGATNAEFDAPRGEWKQIIVDGEKYGTMCGDGTDYAFQIRLAPEGQPLDRIIIGLQGGGVCLFEDDCTRRRESNPGLFNAQDDLPFGGGVASTDPEVSRFADWTKVYMPYCTQDVFTGGGVVEEMGEARVLRYGGKNLRTAIRMVRDVLAQKMDEEGGDGFRPDQLIAFFGGWSAGGYGTIYNYHWMLDDLQWPRTIAFPDAGMALDNGSPLGVSGLGLVKIPAWGVIENLPPYCSIGACAVGPTLYEAISPRLKQVPEQQILVLSNQKDDTQRLDAFFTEEDLWNNTLRESYCETKDLPGIHYYLSTDSDQSIHVISIRDNFWKGAVDGETLEEFFWRAATEPDTMVDRAEEGDFVEKVPGTRPFPCPVAP